MCIRDRCVCVCVCVSCACVRVCVSVARCVRACSAVAVFAAVSAVGYFSFKKCELLCIVLKTVMDGSSISAM